jgi:O-antigen/teichoic acid export membrane protein
VTSRVRRGRPASEPDLGAGDAAPERGTDGAGVPDAGVVRNTLLQLATQLAGAVFTGGLTLYLVRALGPSGYGLYALAVSIGGLIVLPAGLGLPMSIGRFLADHRTDADQLRAILALGIRLQVPVAVLASVALFAAAGPIAHAYQDPGLLWPLRWVALSVAGQALFSFVAAVSISVRQARVGLWMAVIESAAETSSAIVLVLVGAGAAGAALGKTIGYCVAGVAGLYLAVRLLGGPRGGPAGARRVGARAVMGYAGVMFVVDLGVSAIAQVDVLLIGAVLSSAAIGSFSAVMRLLVVAGYLGAAVSGGVAPRLSLSGGSPDTVAFNQALRYLIIAQGLVIAPMLVWSRPIVDLLLGPGYRNAADVLRVLTVYAFVSAPSALISVSVTYLGEGRRRVAIVLGTLLIGAVSIFVLLKALGLVGAAIGDDIIVVVYLAAHVWICSRLITIEVRKLALAAARTALAAAGMALPMLAIGTGSLTAIGWVAGLVAGLAAYAAVLLLTREVSAGELRAARARLRRGSRSASG